MHIMYVLCLLSFHEMHFLMEKNNNNLGVMDEASYLNSSPKIQEFILNPLLVPSFSQHC